MGDLACELMVVLELAVGRKRILLLGYSSLCGMVRREQNGHQQQPCLLSEASSN